MTQPTAPIAILGAGPAGLMLGRLLELAGIDYEIFEREKTAAELRQGGTLDIHTGSGQLALQEAGLFEDFRKLARYDCPTRLSDKHGKLIIAFGENVEDYDRPEIDRKDLRRILLDSVPREKVHWGTKVQQVTRENDLISIHFENGNVQSGYRLVVGADGAWSKARGILSSARPQFSGMYYLTTQITPSNPYYPNVVSLAGNGNYMSIGDGKAALAMRLGDESYTVNAGLRLPENWHLESEMYSDPVAIREWLVKEHFNDWSDVSQNLIKESEGDVRAWPLYALPTDSLEWEHVPGITLIGDAAHLTVPSGEGVNIALHDSLLLAEQIIQHGLEDLDAAVVMFEKGMFPRAVRHGEKAAKLLETIYQEDKFRAWIKAMSGEKA